MGYTQIALLLELCNFHVGSASRTPNRTRVNTQALYLYKLNTGRVYGSYSLQFLEVLKYPHSPPGNHRLQISLLWSSFTCAFSLRGFW